MLKSLDVYPIGFRFVFGFGFAMINYFSPIAVQMLMAQSAFTTSKLVLTIYKRRTAISKLEKSK